METSMLKNLGDKAKDAKDSITKNVGDLVDDAKDNLGKARDKAKGGISDAGKAVQQAYDKAKK